MAEAQEAEELFETTDVAAVQAELERLLSKENLAEDPVIAAALDPQLCVPVAVLAEHPGIRALTKDAAMLITAAERSAVLGVSAENQTIRPLLKSKRNTLILRDVEESATEADIRELLSGSPTPVQELTPDVNSTWFAVFSSEKDAQDAAWWLRTQTIKGEKFSVSMKSEHFLRSFFPAQQPKAPDFPGKGMAGMMPFPFPFGMMPKGKGRGRGMSPEAFMAAQAQFMLGKAKGKGKRGRGQAMPFPAMFWPPAPASPKSAPVSSQVATVLNAKDVQDEAKDEVAVAGRDFYTHEYRRHTRADFIRICGGMSQPVAKPEAYAAVQELLAKKRDKDKGVVLFGDSSAAGFTEKPEKGSATPEKAPKAAPKAKAKAKAKKEKEYTDAEWAQWTKDNEWVEEKPKMKWVAKA